jgi:hypothetical protein
MRAEGVSGHAYRPMREVSGKWLRTTTNPRTHIDEGEGDRWRDSRALVSELAAVRSKVLKRHSRTELNVRTCGILAGVF